MSQKEKPQVIRHRGLVGPRALGTPELWSVYSFAPEWLADALRESKLPGHEARRREILFAVCAAESYIFEWVRDEVLRRDPHRVRKYFKPGTKRGVKQKFKEIPKELKRDGLIAGSLECSGREWEKFCDLVTYRDGLVHAAASRPDNVKLKPDEKPVPSKQTLDSLPAGDALEIVYTLIRKLHRNTKTRQPAWFSAFCPKTASQET